MNEQDQLFDKHHIWHPYTSMIDPLPCYPVKSAQGVYIELADGKKLIDGMSSWWSAIHGYNHPVLNQAAHQQIERMSHIMFGGLTHQPAVDLCQQLIDMTPAGLEKVFVADSGSVAVEVALKMALQFWYNQAVQNGKPSQKTRFLTFSHGYHGDTFAAMSVTDPDNSMHKMYKGFLPQHLFAQSPPCVQIQQGQWPQFNANDLADFTHKLTTHHHEIAAVIIEPIVQGAGGMRIYHPQSLSYIRRLCDHYNVLLILDEIATGFGRTGKLFAFEHAAIEPDILCVGKALTGGYMTLAATLTNRHVAQGVCDGEAGCFMHGPTFMANPLACAVASASLSLIKSNTWQQQVSNIERIFEATLPRLLSYPRVKAVRWLGAIGVIETHQKVQMSSIQELFVQHNVWIRPFGHLIYIMPPYIITEKHLHTLLNAIESALNNDDCFQ